MNTKEHTHGCDGKQTYSDGIFRYCYCEAIVMNTFVGANITKDNVDGK